MSVAVVLSIIAKMFFISSFSVGLYLFVSEVQNSPRPAVRRVAWLQGHADRFGEVLRRKRHWLFRALAFNLAAVFAPLITLMIAGNQASKSGREAWKGHTRVRLVLKAGDKQLFDPELVKANDGRRLALLTQTKDLVVVFEREGDGTLNRSVFILARADVACVHTWSEGERRKG